MKRSAYERAAGSEIGLNRQTTYGKYERTSDEKN